VALQDDIAWAENRRLVGRVLEVLVAEGEGRKDQATRRLSGRARDNRLVHLVPPVDQPAPRPGDVVTVEVTYAAPHHLVADRPAAAVRRTRAGDAWAQRQGAPAQAGAGAVGVLLGLPGMGPPSTAAPAGAGR
jgi:tRNA-2-methylthio-N6-dimethylallyladenosine synthase